MKHKTGVKEITNTQKKDAENERESRRTWRHTNIKERKVRWKIITGQIKLNKSS